MDFIYIEHFYNFLNFLFNLYQQMYLIKMFKNTFLVILFLFCSDFIFVLTIC